MLTETLSVFPATCISTNINKRFPSYFLPIVSNLSHMELCLHVILPPYPRDNYPCRYIYPWTM